MFTPTSSPSVGIAPERVIAWGIARVAFAVGDCGMFDTAQSNAAVTNNNVGDPASGLANVIAPAAAGIVLGNFGLALQTMSVGQKGKFLIVGECDAYVIKSAGSIAAGDALVPTTAKNLSPDHAAGDSVWATAKDAVTTPSTRTLARVFFDGVFPRATLVS